MHQACYTSISSSDKLDRAWQHVKKPSNLAQSICQTSGSEMQAGNSQCDDETGGQMPHKHLHSSIGGPLHDKTECGWCVQSLDKSTPKYTNRARGTQLTINCQVSGIKHNGETRGRNTPREYSLSFSCWWSSYLQDKSPTQKIWKGSWTLFISLAHSTSRCPSCMLYTSDSSALV